MDILTTINSTVTNMCARRWVLSLAVKMLVTCVGPALWLRELSCLLQCQHSIWGMLVHVQVALLLIRFSDNASRQQEPKCLSPSHHHRLLALA